MCASGEATVRHLAPQGTASLVDSRHTYVVSARRTLSPIEIAATLASAAGVWLTARRSVWSWPVSLVGIGLYGWVFFTARLYSDTLLQLAFAVSAVYGWTQWRHAAPSGAGVAVAAPAARELAIGAMAGAVGAAALGAAMAHYTDAAAPWLDAALTSFSLVAQVWTARRYLASWWAWMVLDTVYVGLFVAKALYPTAVLYAVFVALAMYGLAGWRRASIGDRCGTVTPPRLENT